jgi:hypothetical protein
MFRAFRLSGQSFFLPPETPKERVQILREAMRKTLTDPEFTKEFHKLTGDDPTPLMPEALEKASKKCRATPMSSSCRSECLLGPDLDNPRAGPIFGA